MIEVNSALEDTPEIVNERPYETWFYRVKPAGKLDAELAALLGPDDYEKHMDESRRPLATPVPGLPHFTSPPF